MDWFGKLLLTMSGLRAARDSVAHDYRVARTIVSETKAVAARPAAGTDEAVPLFDQRVRELGLTDEDLNRKQGQFTLQARVYFGFAGVTALLLCYFLGSMALAGLLACLGLTPMCLALGARSSFYAWQLRERRFLMFGEWLRARSRWSQAERSDDCA